MILRWAVGKPFTAILLLLAVDVTLSYTLYEFIEVPLYLLMTGDVVQAVDLSLVLTDYWMTEYQSVCEVQLLTPFLWSPFFTSLMCYTLAVWHFVIWFASPVRGTTGSLLL